jgi:hypothetical protein
MIDYTIYYFLFFFYCLTKLELTDNLFITILSTRYIAFLQNNSV